MVRENELLPHSAPSENLSSAISQLEDGPRSGIIIPLTIISCGGGGGAKHLVRSVMDIILLRTLLKQRFINTLNYKLVMSLGKCSQCI